MKIYLESYLNYIVSKASIACLPLIGKEGEWSADSAAVNSMRETLHTLEINAKIIIGEGERDEAPMLYIGEQFGTKHEFDIAVDPLEGTKLAAWNKPGAMAVIGLAEKDTLLFAPDIYMYKIATFIEGEQILDLNLTITENLERIIDYKKCTPQDLKVTILDRERHRELIEEVKNFGAKVHLISDGDIFAVIDCMLPSDEVKVYIGIGGAPEGVLAACALKTLGGQICCKLIFKNESEKEYASKLGITDYNKNYYLNDLVKGNVIFAASGVTCGDWLKGVKKIDDKYYTNCVILNSESKTIKFIENYECLDT